MRLNLDHLPPTAHKLIELIGQDATLALVHHYGGKEIAPGVGGTPASAARMAALAETIGQAAADTLARHYRGSPLRVPACVAALRAAQREQIREEFDRRTRAGESARAVIYDLAGPPPRYSNRALWRLLVEVDAGQVVETGQGSLF